jgi:hypothetical protein
MVAAGEPQLGPVTVAFDLHREHLHFYLDVVASKNRTNELEHHAASDEARVASDPGRQRGCQQALHHPARLGGLDLTVFDSHEWLAGELDTRALPTVQPSRVLRDAAGYCLSATILVLTSL